MVAETVALPQLERVSVADLVALHEDDVWGDYRLALKRSVDASRDGRDDLGERLREDMSSVRRAVQRTTKSSEFARSRAQVTQETLLGLVCSAGTQPFLGTTDAAVAAGVAAFQGTARLFFSWAAPSGDRDERVGRCFGVFV